MNSKKVAITVTVGPDEMDILTTTLVKYEWDCRTSVRKRDDMADAAAALLKSIQQAHIKAIQENAK